MCDCPQEQEDKIVGKIDLETVIIFSKCPTLYRPEEDILEQRTVSASTNLIPIDFVKPDSSDTSCGCARSSSTESSSESSRIVRCRLEIYSTN
jgi:hypothetical protein